MIKKILLIIFLLFIASVMIVPFAAPNCGMNGFYIGFPTETNNCQEHRGIAHFADMADFLLSGNITSIILFIAILFSFVVYNFYYKIKILKLPRLKNIFSRTVIGKLKPFDELLMALKKGIIHPKTF